MGRKRSVCLRLRSKEREGEIVEAGATFHDRKAERERLQRISRESPAVNPEKVNKDVWGQIFSFLTVETAYRLTVSIAKKPDLWYLQAGYTSPSQVRSIQSMWEWVYLSKFAPLSSSSSSTSSSRDHHQRFWQGRSGLQDRVLEPAITNTTRRVMLTTDSQRVAVVTEGAKGDYSRIHWRNACRVASRGENQKVSVRVRHFNKREQHIAAQNIDGAPLVHCLKFWRKVNCQYATLLDVPQPGDKVSSHQDSFSDVMSLYYAAKEVLTCQFDNCLWSTPVQQWAYSSSPTNPETTSIPYSSQQDVFEKVGRPALDALMAGLDSCIMCYGQTGAGKTHTMIGLNQDPGIMVKFPEELFKYLFDRMKRKSRGSTKAGEGSSDEENLKILPKIEVNCFEIYNERVNDMLSKTMWKETGDIKIRQHPTKGVYVEGLITKRVESSEALKLLIQRAMEERARADTRMGGISSRSHAILELRCEHPHQSVGEGEDFFPKVSKVGFIDPAGSERIKMSGCSGQTLQEAKNINLSLATFRKVVDALVDNSDIKKKNLHKTTTVPPYRESILTYYLSNYLDGSSFFHLVACVSPCSLQIEDTLQTLRFAHRFRQLSCDPKPKINNTTTTVGKRCLGGEGVRFMEGEEDEQSASFGDEEQH